MNAHALFFVVLVGCSPPPSKSVPAGPGSAPKPDARTKCVGVVAKDVGKPSTNLECLASFFRENPGDVANALLVIDLDNEQVLTHLGRLPVSSAEWLEVAAFASPRNPKASLKMLHFAERNTSTLELLASISISRLTLGKQTESSLDISRARSDIRLLSERDRNQRLRLVNALAPLDEKLLLSQMCKAAVQDPALVWPCIAADPATPSQYVEWIATLPALSFNNVEQLNKNDKLRGALPGLRCASARSAPDGGRVVKVQQQADLSSKASEVVIYHRLHREAPVNSAACFLEEAAYACVTLLVSRRDCPMPYAISDFVGALSDSARMRFISDLLAKKNALYDKLRGGDENARATLFHFHIAIAEALGSKNQLARDRLWLPQYHISQARSFFELDSTGTIRFGDFVSQSLRTNLCAPSSCETSCNTADWTRCRSDCDGFRQGYFTDVCTP